MSEALKKENTKLWKPSYEWYLMPVVLLAIMLLPRCAQIVAPTGGPKDTLPPVLVNATPPDSTLHFNQKEITLTFNEFIQLQNLQKQMIIAPHPKAAPEFKAKLQTLTIKWSDEDTLKTNTTYIINLGDAIEDINEGNALKGFRYVFSTGGYLDSLELSGKIIDARSGLPDSTALVMLYTNMKDSVVSKEKPVYYTRCNGEGLFRFQNLPHDTFKVFALIDGNGDLEYSDSTEAIAFLKHPLKLDSTQSGLVLSLFKEKKNVPKQETETNTPAPAKSKKAKKLTFQTSLSGQQQDLKKPLVLSFSDPLKSLDSSAILLQEGTTRKPVAFHFQKDTSKNEFRLIYNWKENTPYRLLLDSAFAIDTGGIAYAKKDTLNFKSKSNSDYGSLILHFKLQKKDSITSKDSTVTDSLVNLAATDTTKRSADSLPHPADSLKNSQVSLPVTDSLKTTRPQKAGDTSNYQFVIELYQNDKMIYSAPLKGNTWKKAYLNPGDYNVRVVKDLNFNGKWDRGCYYCKVQRQPEQVYTVPNKFTIRANWKNDIPDVVVKFEESVTK